MIINDSVAVQIYLTSNMIIFQFTILNGLRDEPYCLEIRNQYLIVKQRTSTNADFAPSWSGFFRQVASKLLLAHAWKVIILCAQIYSFWWHCFRHLKTGRYLQKTALSKEVNCLRNVTYCLYLRRGCSKSMLLRRKPHLLGGVSSEYRENSPQVCL